jgi:hypothetical protein
MTKRLKEVMEVLPDDRREKIERRGEEILDEHL